MDKETEWLHALTRQIHVGGDVVGDAANDVDNDITCITITGSNMRKLRGLVLITGGYDKGFAMTSTLILDPKTEQFKKGPRMITPRCVHISVTLFDGNVAVFGGFNRGGSNCDLPYCEIVDTKKLQCRPLRDMLNQRSGASAVVLHDGDVLIIGGKGTGNVFHANCEGYSPKYEAFYHISAKLSKPRTCHAASLLHDGRVFVCGGSPDLHSILHTTEIYDPSSDSFSLGPNMASRRYRHSATTMFDGRVIVCGGDDGTVGALSDSEIYDPIANTFSRGPLMSVRRQGHYSCLLPDGIVMVGGGLRALAKLTTEIYDPRTNEFTLGPGQHDTNVTSSATLF